MKLNDSKANKIIGKIPYITIASVDKDGSPWNAPVFSAYDDELNFYWGSHSGSQHSMNIKANPEVFLVIYDSTVPGGKGEGVYIRAKAEEISDKSEILKAHTLIAKRHIVPYWKLELFERDSPIKLYKAIPKKIWANGGDRPGGVYIDVRKEIE